VKDDGTRIARLDSVTIDCRDPERLASFWSSVFGTAEAWRGGDPVQYIDLGSTDGSPALRFRRVPEPKTVKDRIHLDLRVDDIEEACRLVQVLDTSSERGPASYVSPSCCIRARLS
jgi:catechol 2,3-dioxygenase-like lactoylglutathione lyase family enzyme